VSHIEVKRQETFDIESNATPGDARSGAPRDRYDLATALRIVRRMETSATRAAVFAEITHKNPLYRLVDTLYSKAGASILQPVVLFAYMLKCVLSIGPSDAAEDAVAVSISNFDNERHSADRLVTLVPDARILPLSLKRGHLFGRGQLRAACQLLGSARRIWPFLSSLVRSHGFMPSARIASALAFYLRFVKLFADRPGLNAAIVASNYSPEALGLAAAAHRMGRRVIYINHAPVPANGALVPPVLADCAVFYGYAVRQTYERRSRCTADVALIGQPWTARPMQWRDEVRTVGIFLTALTRAEIVAELIAEIRFSRPDVRILIRNHPVALLRTDFSKLAAEDGNLEITIGTPLDDEIIACDLIICGNSGVAMNALSGGRPVAYMDALDGLNFDYNGFVESGLVCHVTGWSDDIYARLKKFYFNPKWHSVMRSYDASYGADARELGQAAAETIRRYLLPTPVEDPLPTPVEDPLPTPVEDLIPTPVEDPLATPAQARAAFRARSRA
jgi:hypothetical protein